MLPPISPRGGAAGVDPPRRKAGSLSAELDAAADNRTEQVSDWTTHDVAEWLYTQVCNWQSAGHAHRERPRAFAMPAWHCRCQDPFMMPDVSIPCLSPGDQR